MNDADVGTDGSANADAKSNDAADPPYLVEIKRSARKTSAAAGEHVNREGTRRKFDSKALTRVWARDLSSHGAQIWVQDAAPADRRPVDGYLVGGRRHSGARDRPGTQATIDESGD